MRLNLINVLLIAGVLFAGHAFAKEGPGFSLRNKGPATILVSVENDPSLWQSAKSLVLEEADTLLRNRLLSKEINIAKKTTIKIFDQNQKKLYEATFSPGKTIYLNWNPNDRKRGPVYPQQGPLMGIIGETDEGWSLKNNVTANDIKVKR